jgi:hypothetical protein
MDWDTIGIDTMRVPGSLLVGLCVSSHDSLSLKRAVFDSVAVK